VLTQHMISFICSSNSYVTSRRAVSLGFTATYLKNFVNLTVADHVMCNPNPCFSWQLVRLTLKIVMQNDRYFMEVIHL